jgi:hypothetical protein
LAALPAGVSLPKPVELDSVQASNLAKVQEKLKAAQIGVRAMSSGGMSICVVCVWGGEGGWRELKKGPFCPF